MKRLEKLRALPCCQCNAPPPSHACHANSVDTVMIKDVREFVEQTVTENRLQQGLDYMNEMQIPTDIKHVGDFLRWVVGDVTKEESDIIETKGFEKKLVNQEITKVAKRFYFEKFA